MIGILLTALRSKLRSKLKYLCFGHGKTASLGKLEDHISLDRPFGCLCRSFIFIHPWSAPQKRNSTHGHVQGLSPCSHRRNFSEVEAGGAPDLTAAANGSGKECLLNGSANTSAHIQEGL